MAEVERIVEDSSVELAQIRYARELYAYLDENAQDEVIGETPLRVWRGSLTEAFKMVGASGKYYTPMRGILIGTGSIQIVEQGSRNKDSVVVLFKPPPPSEEIFAQGLTTGQPAARLVVEVERRVSALEGWRETIGGINIGNALQNIEQRLAKLEANGK